MSSEVRVIQYGVGPIGAEIVRLLLEKPGMRLVGAIDNDPAKVGQDLGRATKGANWFFVDDFVTEKSVPLLSSQMVRLPSTHQRRLIPYASDAGSPLTMGICSTIACAISSRSKGSR